MFSSYYTFFILIFSAYISVNLSEFNAELCLSKHCNKSVKIKSDILLKQHFSITDTVNECCK